MQHLWNWRNISFLYVSHIPSKHKVSRNNRWWMTLCVALFHFPNFSCPFVNRQWTQGRTDKNFSNMVPLGFSMFLPFCRLTIPFCATSLSLCPSISLPFYLSLSSIGISRTIPLFRYLSSALILPVALCCPSWASERESRSSFLFHIVSPCVAFLASYASPLQHPSKCNFPLSTSKKVQKFACCLQSKVKVRKCVK